MVYGKMQERTCTPVERRKPPTASGRLDPSKGLEISKSYCINILQYTMLVAVMLFVVVECYHQGVGLFYSVFLTSKKVYSQEGGSPCSIPGHVYPQMACVEIL